DWSLFIARRLRPVHPGRGRPDRGDRADRRRGLPRRHRADRLFDRSRLGRRLDLSLFDVGMHLMSHWITNYGLKREDPIRMGTGNSLIFPLRVFPTKTLSVFVAGTNDPFWRLFCNALGRADWLADPRYATNDSRVEHRAELEPQIEAHFLAHTGEELLDKLIPAGMPCSAVYK